MKKMTHSSILYKNVYYNMQCKMKCVTETNFARGNEIIVRPTRRSLNRSIRSTNGAINLNDVCLSNKGGSKRIPLFVETRGKPDAVDELLKILKLPAFH